MVLANYTVDPAILKPYIPFGTELDLWKGKCYVSLVGFMFVNTRVKGIKIPFHVNFEEVNLRFYVRHFDDGNWKRGVVFIKEIVPRAAITFVANTLYKENYHTMPMKHIWFEDERSLNVIYEWYFGEKWHKLSVNASPTLIDLIPGSEEEFITEHYWGYAKDGEMKSSEYEVTHPQWKTYPINRHSIDIDFGAIYGDEFTILNDRKPDSVMLAEGSEITVENKRVLTDL